MKTESESAAIQKITVETCPRLSWAFVSMSWGPLSFRLYPGHTYEGATLTDSVVEVRNQLGNRPVTVVADAGMLSAKNIALLKEHNLSFVVSARIKNLDQSTTSEILF